MIAHPLLPRHFITHSTLWLTVLFALGLLSTPAFAQYYPAMPVMPGGMYGPAQEVSDEDASTAYEQMMSMRRGGMNAGDPSMQPKTELGKRLMQLDFTREPGAVLAARAQLAAEARKAMLEPPRPPASEPAASAPATPATSPAPTTSPDEVDDDANPQDPNSLPPGMTPEMLAQMREAAGEEGGDEAAAMMQAGGNDSAEGAGNSEQAKKRAAEAAETQKKAEHFRVLVVAGDWAAVASFIKDEGKEDAEFIYQHMLNSLQQMDHALLPGEIIALSEAAPGEITDKHITALGSLLRAILLRGSEAGPLAVVINRGTMHFGGEDPVKRKRAASLLVAAGLPVEAQAYLPPLSEARAAKDAELLNLYAAYYQALAKSKQGQDKQAAVAEGWQLCREVMAIEKATSEQRAKVMDAALAFLPDVTPEDGDEFLASLFRDQPDAAWAVLDRACKKATNLRNRQAQPDQRLAALLAIKRLGKSVLDGAGESNLATWRPGLDMLTLTILAEAEDTRMRRGQEQNRIMFIQPEQLAQVLPDPRWLAAIDPGLAAKLETLVAATDGGAGETQSILEMIRPIVDSDPKRATKLGEALLAAWPNYVKPRPANMNYGGYNPYGGRMARTSYAYNPYGGMSYGQSFEGSTPLTRAKQQRNLARLALVLKQLNDLGVKDLSANSRVEAFAASHSDAEVYTPEGIERIFGPINGLPADVSLKLSQNMRQRLASIWRRPQVQQENQTKRSDKQLAAEVIRGYHLARELAEAAVNSKPDDWQAVTTLADLDFDTAEFLYGQKADLATYAGVRDLAFAGYRQAAALYAKALESGTIQPSARVFMQWFSSALGASDLGYLTRQDAPDLSQVDAVAAALNGMPMAQARKHVGLFAQDVTRSMNELNPELKPRFLREAVRIIGDHPDGQKARNQLAYYDDLVNEIQLNLGVDGSTQVGRKEPFGALLSIWCTRAAARETGGFGKYLSNDQYHPMTGQQVDYKDDFEKQIREKLAESFEVISVTFNKPNIQPMGLPREGWEQHPLAYLLLKPEHPSVDRVPPLKLDMDFSDGSGGGLVILPITSPVVLIDANARDVPPRTVSELTIEQTLDDRKAATDGTVRLEIHAKAKGLVPDLEALMDVGAVSGFEVSTRDDHGLNIIELDTETESVVPVTERSWTLDFKPAAAAVAMKSFTFPTAKSDVAKVSLKQYADADLVDAKATTAIAAVRGRGGWWPIWLTAVVVVLMALPGWWLAMRRRSKKVTAKPRFVMPARVTPVDAISLLRKIHAANGEALKPAEQAELLTTIGDLERRYFAPLGGEAASNGPSLEMVLQTWVRRAGAA